MNVEKNHNLINEHSFFLEEFFSETQKENSVGSSYEMELAQNINSYLFHNIERRVTIIELAHAFRISQTELKNTFKKIYGTSVYSYCKGEKMKYAAFLLCKKKYKVLEVAGMLGYSNPSKFAKAFSTVMGTTPSEFLKNR